MNMNNKQARTLGALGAAGAGGGAVAGRVQRVSRCPSSSSPRRWRIAQAMAEFAGRLPKPPGKPSGSPWWASACPSWSVCCWVSWSARRRLAYAAVYPLLVAFNAVPKAAIVPILIVWFGIGVGARHPDRLPDLVFPHHRQHGHRPRPRSSPSLKTCCAYSGAKRWDVLIKVGLPRSMPYFFASLKVSITLAFVGTVLAEMTAGDSGIGYLMQSAGSQQRLALAFAGLVVIGAMAMAMYELFSYVEKHTTGWAHRGSLSRLACPGLAPACAPPPSAEGVLAGVARRQADFLLLRQKKVTKKRRPWLLRPSASLRATCGARFRRGLAELAFGSNNAIPDPPEPPLLGASTRGGEGIPNPNTEYLKKQGLAMASPLFVLVCSLSSVPLRSRLPRPGWAEERRDKRIRAGVV